MSHKNTDPKKGNYIDYTAEGKKLGIEGSAAYDLDHAGDYLRAGKSQLDIALGQWMSGFPLPGWKEAYPNAQPSGGAYAGFLKGSEEFQDRIEFEEEHFKGQKFDEVRLGPNVTDRDTALFEANRLAYAMPGEKRRIDVERNLDGQWSYFYTTPSYASPTDPNVAQGIADELNKGQISTFGGEDDPEYRWVVGNLNTDTGTYYINREKVTDKPDEFDPNNPLMLQTEGPNKGEPVRMDMPDGSTVFVTSDNRFVHSGPEKEGDTPSWLTADFKGQDVKVVTVGKGDNATDWMVWPDGSRTEIGDKFQGGINPKDLELIGGEQLKDGTWVQYLNNGQILRTGRERVDATTTWDNDLKKYKVTQPDGSIGYEEPADPTYDPGLVTIPTDVGDYRFFEQRTGIFTETGLPEVPATIETMEGPEGTDLGYGIRGTQGELLPLDDLLDRAIEAAVVNGDMDKAIAFDDFRKRPSRTEALKMALEFARSPADQVLISAISSGETYIAPPPAGTLQRVGPQADFLVQAYDEFRATLTGGRMPTGEEFQQALAGPPPPEPTELELAQLEAANLQNDLLRTQIANAERAGQNADDKTAEAIAASESKTARDDNTAASKTDNANAITDANITKISATTGKTTTGGGNGNGNGGVDEFYSPQPSGSGTDTVYDQYGNVVSLGEDERLSKEQNAFFEDQGVYTGDLTAENVGLHLRNAMHASGNSELGMKITEGAFDPAVQAAQDKHFADYRAASEWAATLSPEVRNKFGGTASVMMEAHQVALAEEARADLAAQHDVQVGALTDILTGEGGIGTGREGGGPPLPVSGGGAETLGGLSGYPEGTTIADVEAAIEVQNIQTGQETKQQTEIAETPGGFQSKSGEWFSDWPSFEASLGLAGGGRVGSQEMALVGESGPEVALFPNGTEIIPLDRNVKPDQARRLRRRGIRGMQDGGDLGGTVFPLADDIGQVEDVDLSRYGGVLPSGVRRTIAGQGIRPSRGYLSRAAGIGLPSGQALRNMLPEELDVLKDIGAQTGIPERAFERELALGIPSGERQRGSARFLPLSLRS